MPESIDPESGLLLRVNGQQMMLRLVPGAEPALEFVGVMHDCAAALSRHQLEGLLELNFMASADGAWVAVDPQSARVVLMVRRSAAALSVDDVLLVARSMASLVQQWVRDEIHRPPGWPASGVSTV